MICEAPDPLCAKRTEQLPEAFVHSKPSGQRLPGAFSGRLLYPNRTVKEDTQNIQRHFLVSKMDLIQDSFPLSSALTCTAEALHTGLLTGEPGPKTPRKTHRCEPSLTSAGWLNPTNENNFTAPKVILRLG